MDFKTLVQAIEDAGYEARSYSGRDGKQCVGVECQNAFNLGVLLGEAIARLNDVDGEDHLERGDGIRTVGPVGEARMGLDTIVYFPWVAWVDDADYPEDEEAE